MVNLLSLAVILILLIRPIDLFNAGFQLSFVVVLGLFLFVPAIYKRQFAWRSSDFPELTNQMWWQMRLDDTVPWWQLAPRFVTHYAGQLILCSVTAWLVGLPLAAFHFHRITPWAAIGSAILFPLIWLAMMLGFCKLFLAVFSPMLSHFCAGPLYAVSKQVVRLTDMLADLPYSQINIALPPYWLILWFYAMLTLAAWAIYQGKRVHRFFLFGLCFWLIAFIWLVPFRPKITKDSMVMDILAVGHGCSAITQMPDGKVFCYDCGSLNQFDIGEYTVVPFLRSQGINHIDGIFISHANIDHYCGVLDICRNLTVDAVYVSGYFCSLKEKTNSKTAVSMLLNELEKLHVPVFTIHRDSSISGVSPSKEDYTVDVLWPPALSDGYELDENDASIVLRISNTSQSILLTGDIGSISQEILLEQGKKERLQSDVLLLPHHGSTRTNLPEFLSAVNPTYGIISNGYMEPEKIEILEQLLPKGEIMSTYENGAIHLILKPEGITIHTFHQ
jgi:competence protein ComEC